MRFLTVAEYASGSRLFQSVATDLAANASPLGHLLAASLGFADLIELTLTDSPDSLLRADTPPGKESRRATGAYTRRDWVGWDDETALVVQAQRPFVGVVYARLSRFLRATAAADELLIAERVVTGIDPAHLGLSGGEVLARPFVGLDATDAVFVVRACTIDDLSDFVGRLRGLSVDGLRTRFPVRSGHPVFRHTSTVLGVHLQQGDNQKWALPQQRDRVVAREGALLTRLRFPPSVRANAEEGSKNLGNARLVRIFGQSDALVIPDKRPPLSGGGPPHLGSLLWSEFRAHMETLIGQEAPFAHVRSTTEVVVATRLPRPTFDDADEGAFSDALERAHRTLRTTWRQNWKKKAVRMKLPWSLRTGGEALIDHVLMLLTDDPEAFCVMEPSMKALIGSDGLHGVVAEVGDAYTHLREKAFALSRREHAYLQGGVSGTLEGVGYQVALAALESTIESLLGGRSPMPFVVIDSPSGRPWNETVAGIGVLRVSSLAVRHPFMWIAALHEAAEITCRTATHELAWTGRPSIEAFHDLVVHDFLFGRDAADSGRASSFVACYGPALVNGHAHERTSRGLEPRVLADLELRVFLVCLGFAEVDVLLDGDAAERLWLALGTRASEAPRADDPLPLLVIRQLRHDLHVPPSSCWLTASPGRARREFDLLRALREEEGLAWRGSDREIGKDLGEHIHHVLVTAPLQAGRLWLEFRDKPAKGRTHLYDLGGIHLANPDAQDVYDRAVLGTLGRLADAARSRRFKYLEGLL